MSSVTRMKYVQWPPAPVGAGHAAAWLRVVEDLDAPAGSLLQQVALAYLSDDLPTDAVARTVEIHNELMHTFVKLAAQLSATGSPNLRRFLADTWAWLGGSRRWHATTGRYNKNGSRE